MWCPFNNSAGLHDLSAQNWDVTVTHATEDISTKFEVPVTFRSRIMDPNRIDKQTDDAIP